MSKEIHTQKHMTLSDRIFIEQSLANHNSFKEIASVLKKDPSTISKEIRKHRMFKEGSHYNLKNNCALLSSCQRVRICDRKLCNSLCKRSKTCDCTKHCPDFTPYLCPKLTKPPYVCNGCPNHACRYDKYFPAHFFQCFFCTIGIDGYTAGSCYSHIIFHKIILLTY